MSNKHGAERVARHFDRPNKHAHAGGRSRGERALLAAAAVGGLIVTAPYWAPLVATAAILAAATATIAVATAPLWGPVALIGYVGYRVYKAGRGERPQPPHAMPRDLPRKFQHEYPYANRGDARRVGEKETGADIPGADRRRPVVGEVHKVTAPKLSLKPKRRAVALPRL